MAALVHAGPRRWIQTTSTATVDLVFPPRCVSCQSVGSHLCPGCAQNAEPVGDEICLCCGRRQPGRIAACVRCEHEQRPISLARAATIHHGPIREGIHLLKYGSRPDIAPLLARYLVAASMLDPWPLFLRQIDGVTPVPLHTERRRERGYNQAELLADAFCTQVGLPLYSGWLSRRRLTHSQVGLRAQERQANVTDAFVADPSVGGQRILLIDDVYTTGATLQACAEAALRAGARSVYALALATPAHVANEVTADA
jgi:ComF family protein